MILIWSGSIGQISSIAGGWVLCDGSNGTPDLRDRFVIGAGNAYSVAQTGGSADSIVVSHTHTATSVVTDPGHKHTYNGTVQNPYQAGGNAVFSPTTAANTSTATTGITVATTNASTGVSATNANLPPYYALCYIMKT
jgi:hypothetical protein